MKWNNTYIAAFITAFIGISCLSVYLYTQRHAGANRVIGGAYLLVAKLIIFMIAGAVFVSIAKTESIGQGIFIGAAVTFVIGFGICTAAS